MGGSESKRRDAETARRLFVVVLLVYGLFYSGQFTSSDEVAIFQMARSLVEDGDLGVPPLMHTGIGADGVTRHSFFAVGQSVIAVPFVVLAKVAGVALPESWLTAMAGPTMGPAPNTLYSGSYEIFITGLYGLVMTALLVSFYFWFQRQLGASPRSALIAALALAFGSYLFQLSSYFLRHPTEAVLVLGALVCLRAWSLRDERRFLWLAAACASSVFLVRVPSVVFGVGFGAAVLWVWAGRIRAGRPTAEIARDALALAVPLACAAAIHVGINEMRWGSLLESPMTAQRSIMDNPTWLGMAGLLFSPGVSLFLYSPLLVLAPWALWSQRKREPLLIVTSLAIFACFLVFVGSYRHWPGLWSAPGPRYLYLCIPLLLLPLGTWLDADRRRVRLLLVLAALGVCVQVIMLLAPWGDTVAHMGYAKYGPEGPFLWWIGDGVVPGSLRTVLVHGDLNPWLLKIAKGWTGFGAAPGLAIALLIAWTAAFFLSVSRLRASLGAAS